MPDHSIDAPDAATRGGRRRRSDWRQGGRSVRGWHEGLLAGALLSLGAALITGTLLAELRATPWVAASATLVVWAGMLAPVVWGLSRSRPAGLLRFRAVDVLYGVVLAAVLRVMQGAIEAATGGTGALPHYPTVGGALADGWWLTDFVAVVGVAPVVEEFFFRGVILIAAYGALRRPVGWVAAGVIATLVSTALFVIVHVVAGQIAVDQIVTLSALALTGAALVLLTGRLWGAVLVHVIYNASFVVLALAGTVWG